MKIIQILVMGGLVFVAGVGCSKQSDGVAVDGIGKMDSAAWESSVTGDKEKMAQLMRSSYAKGTFDDALKLLFVDSTIAVQVIASLRDDPRLAGMFASATTIAPSSGGSSSRSGSVASRSSSARRATGTTPRKDPLDKAEDGVRKANEKLDQAERIRRAADEARRKAERVLHP